MTSQAGLTNVLGALYASVLFFAVINALIVQPVLSAERAVSYRERAAGMYSFWPWTLAIVSAFFHAVQQLVYAVQQTQVPLSLLCSNLSMLCSNCDCFINAVQQLYVLCQCCAAVTSALFMLCSIYRVSVSAGQQS